MRAPGKYRNMEFRGLIVEMVNLFQPETYVEIGVQRAYTFNTISPLVKRAVAVDIVDTGRIAQHPNVETYIMPSIAFSKLWKDPIDLLFIDADHTKESVLADFNALAPYVADNGLVLLHDTHPVQESLLREGYCSNAWEAARKIHLGLKYRDWEIVTLPGPWAGLSIARRAPEHLMWREE